MNKKDTAYRMPEGFNPYTTMDAIRGLADAIHHTTLEGACANTQMPYPDKAALNGLVELLRVQVHAMHDYLAELENRCCLDLPLGQAELDALDDRYTKHEVREEAPLYLVG